MLRCILAPWDKTVTVIRTARKCRIIDHSSGGPSWSGHAADEDLRVEDGQGRGHSIGRKSVTPGSALPLTATSRLSVPDGGGSIRITDSVSSIHAHHAHHGQGGHDYSAGDQSARNSAASHSGSPHTLFRPTGQPGVGQGENDRSAHSSVVAPRVASAFPTYGRESDDTDVGCNGWTIAKKSTGVQRAPRELRPDVLSNPSFAGASTEQSGMSQPMYVDLSGGIGVSTTNTQNFIVNQTNILSESCVFGNVRNQAVANHTAVDVGATMQVAEERHSVVVNTHHYEMEDARQNARVAQEINKQLQELVLRLQDKANADSARVDRLRDRLQNKATADSARVDRLRELEIAFDIQNNEVIMLKREKDASAHSAQARASAWAAAHPVSSSSGEGNHFQELSSGGAGASQPGRLESLALTKNFLGYVKGALPNQRPHATPQEGTEAVEALCPIIAFSFPSILRPATRRILSHGLCPQ